VIELNAAKRLISKHFGLVIGKLMHIAGYIAYLFEFHPCWHFHMKITLRITHFFLLLISLLIAVPAQIQAQESTDITNIKVDELSDEQLQELLRRANEAVLVQWSLFNWQKPGACLPWR